MTATSGARPLPRSGRWILGLLLGWSLLSRLLFASVGLDERRFWDERYSLENVRHILESGRLEPVSGWYPMPSYLPHTALLAAMRSLHERSGREVLAVVRDDGFTPAAYLLCRSLQALFGTASLLLLFLLVRRFGDWRDGLLAAFLLAATPNHLRLSVYFKPDAVLLCATLLAVLVAVRLVQDASRPAPEIATRSWSWRTAVAGATVTLAASVNLSGLVTAAPVATAVLLAGGSARRRLGGLALAGSSSAALFFAANPAWRLQLEHLRRIRRQYLEQSVGSRHLDVLTGEVEALLSPAFFGPLLGAAGLLGLAALAYAAVRDAGRRRALAVALVFPLAFSVVFAASTTYAKENHFLQVAPYVAWGAAAVLLQIWDRSWTFAGAPARRRRLLRPALVLTAVGLVGCGIWEASRRVYEAKVPTTASVLAQRLRPALAPLPWRLLWVESDLRSETVPLVSWRDRAAVVEAATLLDVPAEELALADGEVVAQSRLRGKRGDLYRELLQRHPDRAERFEVSPLWLRARGPALVAMIDPWVAVGERMVTLEPAAAGEWRGVLPAEGEAEVLSLRVWLPRQGQPPSLDLDGERLPLHSTRTDGRQDRYLSPRRRGADGGKVRLHLTDVVLFDGAPVLEVRYWKRGSAP